MFVDVVLINFTISQNYSYRFTSLYAEFSHTTPGFVGTNNALYK